MLIYTKGKSEVFTERVKLHLIPLRQLENHIGSILRAINIYPPLHHYTPHNHLLLMPRKSGFPFHHLVIQDENMVWVYVESGFPTTLAVPQLMKRYFPNYEYSLCRRETFLKLGGKL